MRGTLRMAHPAAGAIDPVASLAEAAARQAGRARPVGCVPSAPQPLHGLIHLAYNRLVHRFPAHVASALPLSARWIALVAKLPS